MGAIVIKLDSKSNKILVALVKKLGGNVFTIGDDQYENFLLGALMDEEKTGELVSRELIIEKLNKK